VIISHRILAGEISNGKPARQKKVTTEYLQIRSIAVTEYL
jgi:hypothetical protein